MARTSDPIDLDMAADIMGDDSDAAGDYLFDLYLRTFPGSLAKLEQAVADGIPATVRDAAHSAKGVAANTAAVGLRDRLSKLEQAALEYRMAEVKELLRDVQGEVIRVKSFIEDRKRDGGD